MKKLFLAFLLLSNGAFAQNGEVKTEAKSAVESGIEFFHGTFDEALKKAKEENKLVFMDAYAEWCGPCKRMAATTFKDEKVGKFMNDNFVNVKMDMEKGEGPDLQRKFDVSAYPTLLFLNEKGESVHKSIGGLDNAALIAQGRAALSKIDNTKDFEKDYTAGKRDAGLVLNYVRALNRAGKPSLKVVNDFLLKNTATNDTTQRIIFEGTTQADSKVFDLLVKNRLQIAPLFSEKLVNDRLEAAIEKTMENAIAFKSEDLQKEAKEKMAKYFPAKADMFSMESDIKFSKATADVDKFCKACDVYVKKEAKSDARRLYLTAKNMTESFPYDKTVLAAAEKYLKKAAENGGMVEYVYLYAQTLHRIGKKSDALAAAEKALKIAQESAAQFVPAVQQLIEQIKEKS